MGKEKLNLFYTTCDSKIERANVGHRQFLIPAVSINLFKLICFDAVKARLRTFAPSCYNAIFEFLTVYFLFFFMLLQNNLFPDVPKSPIYHYLTNIEIEQFDSGLKSIDCIYVINLDERIEKWKKTKSQCDGFGLNVNRVSAVNGWKLSQIEQKELCGPFAWKLESNTKGIPLNAGRLGCLLSHVSVYQDAYQRGFQCIWVMEDDVKFLKNPLKLSQLIVNLCEIDPNWDILYTDTDSLNKNGEHRQPKVFDFRPDESLTLNSDYFKTRTAIANDFIKINSRLGTHSMIMSRNGLKKILDYYSNRYIYIPIDCDLFFIPDIRLYTLSSDFVSTFLKKETGSDTSMNSSFNSN